jgi:hypothetical protein
MERHFKPICICEINRLLSKNLSWKGCHELLDFKYSAEYLQICLAVVSISRKLFGVEVDEHLHDVFACSEKFLTLPKTTEILFKSSSISIWITYDAMLSLSEFMAAVGQDVRVANTVELSWLSLWNCSER